LEVDGDLTIRGPGADLLTVSGNQASPVFRVLSFDTAKNITLSGLTLADARGGIGGGALSWLGASGTLTIQDCLFSGNRASRGAGISAFAFGDAPMTVNISNTTFANNQSPGGVVHLINANTTLSDCTISGNSGSDPLILIANTVVGGETSATTLLSCTIA